MKPTKVNIAARKRKIATLKARISTASIALKRCEERMRACAGRAAKAEQALFLAKQRCRDQAERRDAAERALTAYERGAGTTVATAQMAARQWLIDNDPHVDYDTGLDFWSSRPIETTDFVAEKAQNIRDFGEED